MLVECDEATYLRFMADDPVRPDLFDDDVARFQHPFRVFAHIEPGDELVVNAIVCIVVCPYVPIDEEMLRGALDTSSIQKDIDNLQKTLGERFGVEAHIPEIVVPYSLWSYRRKRHAARDLVNELLEYVSVMFPTADSIITMSPPTSKVRAFHTSNGAEVFGRNKETINYEYLIPEVHTH